MNFKILVFILVLSFLVINSALAVPPPCSEEGLLETSDYAIEGHIKEIQCGEPYDSKECEPRPGEEKQFKPELVSDCVATVKVTKNIKGEKEEVKINFLKIVQECENGDHIIPGSPHKTTSLKVGRKLRYYNSDSCAYSNLDYLGEVATTSSKHLYPPIIPKKESGINIYSWAVYVITIASTSGAISLYLFKRKNKHE